ncbi:MAG TPA: peptidoglycan DD-metalloendopeptidase family protein [Thermoleophilaceae bacterium]|nr:peptidoglycan DD-metalloendopeptidase family protein [Thermoleophilaceae bacterium]
MLVAAAVAGSAQAAGSGGGGAVYVAKPEVAKVTCLRRCASRRRAQGGSTLKIGGRSLGDVATVVFHGSYGRSDDAVAKVRSGSETRVHARVPVGAVTGPVSVVSAGGVGSAKTRSIAILPPPPPAPNAQLSPAPGPSAPGAPAIETGTSRTKAFVGARRAVTFSYRLSAAAPVDVTVELVRATDGTAVTAWPATAVPPGEVRTVTWSGSINGAAAAPGRYSFRLTAQGSNGQVARSAQAQDFQRDAFDLYDHVFPVRGRHNFGGGGAQFGAGRGGRSHQGHDVFARCGTRMVAARGGRVQYSGYHGAAGNYIVIDGAGTGVDYAYMHLSEPSPFRAGDRVYTGQQIGAVGETGNARGCHLHFETWGEPGWYQGGRPFDPLPSLQAWDAWS